MGARVKTEELIVELARSARPVTPLAGPGVRALRWIVVAMLVLIAGAAIAGPREDITTALGDPRFLGSLATLLITLTTGAVAAFALSVPGASRSRWQGAMPVITAAAWSAIWLVALGLASAPAVPRTAAFHPACAVQVAVCALLSGSFLFGMIARAAPLQRLWTAAVASLAAVATGAAVAQLACPLDDPRHQLIGHVVVALAVAAAGLLIGRGAFGRWERHDG